jgi:hypothetical protein
MIGNFVQETANAPGSAATVTLAGPAAGRRGIIAAFGGGATVYLGMDDGTQWQLVEALTVAGPPQQITITAVINNSAGTTNRLNFTGSVRIYSAIPAERNVYQTTGGAVVVAGEIVSAVGSLTTRAAGNRNLFFGHAAGAEAALVWHDAVANTFNMRLAGQNPALTVESNGDVRTNSGWLKVRAASSRHLLFQDDSGGERGLVWSDASDNTLRMRANGGTAVTVTSAGHVVAPLLRGGPSDAGTLRAHGTANSVNFRWDDNWLLYRVDEVVERRIMVAPTSSAGVSQWQAIGDTLPSGGTWAYFVLAFLNGGINNHQAGVAAGGSTVATGGNGYTGFAWRIA